MQEELKSSELKSIEARALSMFKHPSTSKGLKAGLRRLVESCARVAAILSVEESKSVLL